MIFGNNKDVKDAAPVTTLDPNEENRKYVDSLRTKEPTVIPISLEELTQARNKLSEIRSKYDIISVERAIRALQTISRIQLLDRELKSTSLKELQRFKVIKQILDDDQSSVV